MLFQRNKPCWLTAVDFLLTLVNKTGAHYQCLNEKKSSGKPKEVHALTSISIEKYQVKLFTNKKLLIYKRLNPFEHYNLSRVTDFKKEWRYRKCDFQPIILQLNLEDIRIFH